MIKQSISYSNIIRKLTQQRRVVGLLKFEVREENNFAKWYSLTENLVIKTFGPKSNQLQQLQELYGDMRSTGDFETVFDRKIETIKAKEKLKNLLTVFVEELKMDNEPEKLNNFSTRTRARTTKNVLTATQTVNTSVSIRQIIEQIRETEPDPVRVQQAEAKLKELEEELKQNSPAWAKIKGVLEWLLNFSRDSFIAVLPAILEQYKK